MLVLASIAMTIPPQWITWIPIAISASSLLISVFAAWFTLQGYLRGRPRLTLTQSTAKKGCVVIEPDWEDGKTASPDRYINYRYRLIMEVTIRNKSSNSISISTFKLNDHFTYGSFIYPGPLYTIQVRASQHILGSGITSYGPSEKVGFPIKDEWINPVVHLQPFDIVRGYLFWPVFEEDLKYINIGGYNDLVLDTTFKPVHVKVKVNELIDRDHELPLRKDWTFSSPFKAFDSASK